MLRNVNSKWSLKLLQGTGLEAECVSDNHRDTWPVFVTAVHSDSQGIDGLLLAENCRIWDEKEGAERQKSFFDEGFVCGGA